MLLNNKESITNFVINRYCDDNDKVFVELSWNDPEDTLWQNTVIVRNDNHFPINETDGIVVATSTEKNKYATTPLIDQDETISKDKDYFYKLFPLINNGYISDDDNERIAINYTNPPDNTLNFTITDEEQDIKITWEDPQNFNWTGTVLVRKINSEPVNVNDGSVVCINKVYNQYKINPFIDKSLCSYKNYYYKLFPYNNNNIFNINCESKSVMLKDNIIPKPVTGLNLIMDKDINNNVICKLTWKDSEDYDWESTTVVKKLDSFPNDVNDGELVIKNTERDKYITNALIDSNDADNNYYYKLFPCDLAGNYNISEDNNITLFNTESMELSKLYDFNKSNDISSWQWSSDNSYLFCEKNTTNLSLQSYKTFETNDDAYLGFEYIFKGKKIGEFDVYDNNQLIFSTNVSSENWETGNVKLVGTSHNIVFWSYKSIQYLDLTQQLCLKNIVVFYKK